jgi:hypothetical protein
MVKRWKVGVLVIKVWRKARLGLFALFDERDDFAP